MSRRTNNKHKPAEKLTPFERETKRRRAEMLRNLAGFRVSLPTKRLKRYIADGVKPVMVKNDDGKLVHLTKQYPTRRNPFREIARQQSKHTKAVAA